MRRMLMSRCSLENPSSDDRCLRTTSPSTSVTVRPPISSNGTRSTLATVDLPEPDSPVSEHGETLLAAGMGLAQLGSNGGEGEPLRDRATVLKAFAQLGSRDRQGAGTRWDLVIRGVGCLSPAGTPCS